MAVVSTAEATRFFEDADTSGDGTLSIQELRAMVGAKYSDEQVAVSYEHIDIFNVFLKRITLRKMADNFQRKKCTFALYIVV